MTNTAEAKVIVKALGSNTWRDSLDFDPVKLPVAAYEPNTQIPAYTDSRDAAVMSLVEAVIEAEMDADLIGLEYLVVWSDLGFPVKAYCAMCDDLFIASEGFSNELPDGTPALQCGCVDED